MAATDVGRLPGGLSPAAWMFAGAMYTRGGEG